MPSYATPHHAPHGAPPASSRAGIDLKTLFITAASSAAAAYTCSQLWAPGTLAAAAFTPVLVALIKEALAKSTDAVTRAVPVKGVVRSARREGPQPPGQPGDGTLVQMPEDAAEPEARVAQFGEIQYHAPRRMRGWRLAIVTGLLGFLVCAVVFTVPELLAGNSASGGGRETTIFGGKERDREPATTTITTQTQTQTVTTPQAKTVTLPPPTVTTTTPTTTQPPPAPTTTTTPAPTTTNPEEPVAPDPPAPQPPG